MIDLFSDAVVSSIVGSFVGALSAFFIPKIFNIIKHRVYVPVDYRYRLEIPTIDFDETPSDLFKLTIIVSPKKDLHLKRIEVVGYSLCDLRPSKETIGGAGLASYGRPSEDEWNSSKKLDARPNPMNPSEDIVLQMFARPNGASRDIKIRLIANRPYKPRLNF